MIKKMIEASIAVLCLLAVEAVYAVPSVDYSIAWDASAERYRVYMKPISVPSPNNNLTAQVTVKAPYETDQSKITVIDLISPVASATWSISSTIHAPTENQNASYISFFVLFDSPDAYTWATNQEIEVFNFKNSGDCLGSLSLIDSSDTFNFPNSVGTTPDNQITNTGWGSSNENNYRSNYEKPADCTESLSITKTVSSTSATAGDNLIYRITITNPSEIDANNVKVVDQLPSSVSFVSDDSSGAYNANTGIWLANISKQSSKTLNITVVVN